MRCNLSCRHCGSDCRVDPGVRDMPIEDFLKVLDEEVTPHVDPAQVLVIFSGGEVLVRPDLERAGAEVTRRGYAWGMVTNGLGLTESRFRSLLDAGLRTVSVSLDGFEREHNYIRCNPLSYERALGALRMIVREPSLACDVVTCVTGAMVPRLGDFCGMLVAEGLKHWRLFSIFPMGRAKDDPSLRTTDEQFRAMLEFILGGSDLSCSDLDCSSSDALPLSALPRGSAVLPLSAPILAVPISTAHPRMFFPRRLLPAALPGHLCPCPFIRAEARPMRAPRQTASSCNRPPACRAAGRY